MAKKTINVGSQANDGLGDPLRTAFKKINDNFDELFGDGSTVITLGSPQITTPTITGLTTIDSINIKNNTITTNASNADLELDASGAGDIELLTDTNITGALDVTGAVTLDTSLTLAAGATITAFSTSTALGTSDTVVPTQNAVKSYVDTQLTTSNLAFAGDTGGTLNIDLDSETLTIAGGTGIDTSGSSNTLTIAIDSSVVTLTGGQVLTNKTLTSPTIDGATMTGNVTVDNLIFNDSRISTATNADIELVPGGTGTISLQANTNVSGTFTASGNTTISGTLSTANITTTGSQTVTGNFTAQGTVFSDKISSQATNANVAIVAQGTGVVDIQSAMTTIGQTITGTASVTGQLNVDLLRIDNNIISSTDTNGNIIISPNGTGLITLGPNGNTVQASNVAVTTLSVNTGNVSGVLTVQGTTITDRIETASNADLVLDPQGTGTVDFKVPAQDTVGSAGAASALPANPTGYFKIKVNGYTFVVPYYAQS
jgi:hypothetical protein